MTRRLPVFFLAAAIANFSPTIYAQVSRHAPTMLTQSIREDRTITLARNTHPLANRANDRGLMAENVQIRNMFLQLRRPPEQQQALERFLAGLHDANSPDFHKWLTAAQFGEQFGIAKDDLDVVTGWLKGQGFTVNTVYSNLVVNFSGNAGQVRRAFHVPLHRLSVGGKLHRGNIEDPQIPAALAPLVVGVASLNDFMPQPLGRAIPTYTESSSVQAVVPSDLATIYNLNPALAAGFSGQGQTIAVVQDSNLYNVGDWSLFRKVFGLARPYPNGRLITTHPGIETGGGCLDPGTNSDDAEAILDAEWATAAAPNATIMVASCDNTFNFGGFIALQGLLNSSNPPPSIVSISYGVPEIDLGAANNAYVSSLYQMAVAEGVSIFVSTGDSGAAFLDRGAAAASHGITVSGYASTPYNVAVGGTDFADTYLGAVGKYWDSANSPTYGSARSYIPEIPWNLSCASELLATNHGFATTYGSAGYCANGGATKVTASGGGPSTCATGSAGFGGSPNTCAGYAKPAWQTILGNPNDGVRDIPDLALFASNGVWGHFYVACYSDLVRGGKSCLGAPNTWSGFGGTSISAPIMAGFQALINEKTGSRWGNPNPIYYRLASNEFGATGNASCDSTGSGDSSPCAFHDITLGDIAVDCVGSNACFFGSTPGQYGVLSTSNTEYQPAYRAGVGWDYATGLGSVNVWNLLESWPSSQEAAASTNQP